MNRRTDLIRDYGETIVSVLFLLLGVGVLMEASNMKYPVNRGWMFNIAMWPRTVGLVLCGLSIVNGIRAAVKTIPSPQLWLGPRPWILVASFGVYILLLPVLGYFLASFVWTLFVARLAGAQRWLPAVMLGVALTIVGYLIFWRILYVSLPIGFFERLLGLHIWLYR
jgi:hypothetical protein